MHIFLQVLVEQVKPPVQKSLQKPLTVLIPTTEILVIIVKSVGV